MTKMLPLSKQMLKFKRGSQMECCQCGLFPTSIAKSVHTLKSETGTLPTEDLCFVQTSEKHNSQLTLRMSTLAKSRSR